jgi:hypothetical protein
MFIPDPDLDFFPHTGSGFKTLVWDLGSKIRDPGKPIPDRGGGNKALGPESATLVKRIISA